MDNPYFLKDLILELHERLENTEFDVWYEWTTDSSGSVYYEHEDQFNKDEEILDRFTCSNIEGTFLIVKDRKNGFMRIAFESISTNFFYIGQKEYFYLSRIEIS